MGPSAYEGMHGLDPVTSGTRGLMLYHWSHHCPTVGKKIEPLGWRRLSQLGYAARVKLISDQKWIKLYWQLDARWRKPSIKKIKRSQTKALMMKSFRSRLWSILSKEINFAFSKVAQDQKKLKSFAFKLLQINQKLISCGRRRSGQNFESLLFFFAKPVEFFVLGTIFRRLWVGGMFQRSDVTAGLMVSHEVALRHYLIE